MMNFATGPSGGSFSGIRKPMDNMMQPNLPGASGPTSFAGPGPTLTTNSPFFRNERSGPRIGSPNGTNMGYEGGGNWGGNGGINPIIRNGSNAMMGGKKIGHYDNNNKLVFDGPLFKQNPMGLGNRGGTAVKPGNNGSHMWDTGTGMEFGGGIWNPDAPRGPVPPMDPNATQGPYGPAGSIYGSVQDQYKRAGIPEGGSPARPGGFGGLQRSNVPLNPQGMKRQPPPMTGQLPNGGQFPGVGPSGDFMSKLMQILHGSAGGGTFSPGNSNNIAGIRKTMRPANPIMRSGAGNQGNFRARVSGGPGVNPGLQY